MSCTCTVSFSPLPANDATLIASSSLGRMLVFIRSAGRLSLVLRVSSWASGDERALWEAASGIGGGEPNERESLESELCRGGPSSELLRGGASNEPCRPGTNAGGDVGLRGSDGDMGVLPDTDGDTSFSLSGLLAKGELTTGLFNDSFVCAICVGERVRGSCENGLGGILSGALNTGDWTTGDARLPFGARSWLLICNTSGDGA